MTQSNSGKGAIEPRWGKFFSSVFFSLLIFCVGIQPAKAIELFQLQQFATALDEPMFDDGSSDAAQLLRVLKWEGTAQQILDFKDEITLPQYAPFGWNAIDPALCAAVNIDPGRCLSLACFLLDGAPQGHQICPAAVLSEISGKAPQPGGIPSVSELPRWMKSLSDALGDDEDIVRVKAALASSKLPLDATVIGAKGYLHRIWPVLREQIGAYGGSLTPGQMLTLVRDVAISEEKRLVDTSWIIAVAAIARMIQNDTDFELPSPHAGNLIEAADALEKLFLSSGLPAMAERDTIDKNVGIGRTAISGLRAFVRDAAQHLELQLAESIVAEICPKPVESHLVPVADPKSFGSVEVSLAFKRPNVDSNPDVSNAWNLMAVVGLKDGESEKIAEAFNTGETQEAIDNAVQCAEAFEVIDLGISIRGLEATKDGVRLTELPGLLLQSTNITKARAGLEQLVRATMMEGNERARAHFPNTLQIENATLSFDDQFTKVDLHITAVVPVLETRTSATVRLIDQGELVLESSIEALLDLEGTVGQVNRWFTTFGPTTREVGPFQFTIENAKLLDAEQRRSGNWLRVNGTVRSGYPDAASISAVLTTAPGGRVEFDFDADVEGLLRGMLRDQIDRLAKEGLGLAHLLAKSLPAEIEPELSKQVAAFLLIDKIVIAADGTAEVVLLVDIGSLTEGRINHVITARSPLDLSRDDLGLPAAYAALTSEAVTSLEIWRDEALKQINLEFAGAADEAIAEAARGMSEKLGPLGISVEFRKVGIGGTDLFASDRRKRHLVIKSAAGAVEIRDVFVDIGAPWVDFSEATIDATASRQLGEWLQVEVVSRLRDLADIGWTACGQPNIQLAGRALRIETYVETSWLGCMPLPAIQLDGSSVDIDVSAMVHLLEPIIIKAAVPLIPEDVREFVVVSEITIPGLKELVVPVEAPVPGFSSRLKGTVFVDLQNLNVRVDVNTDEAVFDEALGVIADYLTGGGIEVDVLDGEFGLRATVSFDAFAGLGITARNLEITPARVYLPEISVRTPIVVAIGPITVTPIEVQVNLTTKEIGLAGDGSFAATREILMIRARMGLSVQEKTLSHSGKVILATVLDLFETNGSINLEEKRMEAEARTVGLLRAILPMDSQMTITPERADTEMSANLLGIKIDSQGVLRLTNPPDIEINGSINVADIANVEAGLYSDLNLSNPSLTVSGNLDLLLFDVDFGGRANLRGAKVNANALGVSVSVSLPGIDRMNGGMLEELFKDLLSPSIDLAMIKELNINLSTTISSGGEGAHGGEGENEGDNGQQNGGTGQFDGERVAPEVLPQAGGRPVQSRGDDFRDHGVPSEWQSGYRAAPHANGFFCRARWKSERDEDTEWDPYRYPGEIAKLLSEDAPSIIVTTTADPVTRWERCTTEEGTSPYSAVNMFFDGTNEPKLWIFGSDEFSSAPWASSVLNHVDGLSAAAVVDSASISSASKSIIRLLFLAKLDGAAIISDVVTASGREFMVLDLRENGGVHLFERGSNVHRVFSNENDLAAIVRDAVSQAEESGSLRDRLLPLLFDDRKASILYSEDQRLLLLANYDAHAFDIGAGTCAPPVPHRGARNESDILKPIFDSVASEVQFDLGCDQQSVQWGELNMVANGGELQRAILSRSEAATWDVAFVDLESNRPCIRTGLDEERLIAELKHWETLGALSAEEMSGLLGQDGGFARIITALNHPDIAWREQGFPLNPFAFAMCSSEEVLRP